MLGEFHLPLSLQVGWGSVTGSWPVCNQAWPWHIIAGPCHSSSLFLSWTDGRDPKKASREALLNSRAWIPESLQWRSLTCIVLWCEWETHFVVLHHWDLVLLQQLSRLIHFPTFEYTTLPGLHLYPRISPSHLLKGFSASIKGCGATPTHLCWSLAFLYIHKFSLLPESFPQATNELSSLPS